MTQMTEVNVADATGAALDWMVAKAENFQVYIKDGACAHREHLLSYEFHYSPSTNWLYGGPMIDWHWPLFTSCQGSVRAEILGGVGMGGTYLIAACRAIVTAKLGNKVMVPVELAASKQEAS